MARANRSDQAFEVGVDFHRRHDRAQVDGHGLIEREQPEAAVVDFGGEGAARLAAGPSGARAPG
jgi:hypothetical protein